ncbi:methyltransferase domain-containing protein [Gorillibacterium timonense]|uniref:methyltransferase domain-containing protein n=1 Tax=Gorillibacterium timonense TaxID=1689269 RepID=UPI00071D3981|nr:methyltransferase domain-containing protein [Gorillibacterium timonense]
MADWNSKQYLLFANERTQPAIDLANRIQGISPRRIIDIGCGPGNSTAVLAKRFPDASILGIDQSEAMIAAAKADYPELDFVVCDAEVDLPTLGGGFDIVFSNACIQWIPNHPKLLRDMAALLEPGGILAVQTPMNDKEPIHRIIQEVTASEKWRPYISEPRIFYNLQQEEYFDLLAEITPQFTLWETVYFHKMKSHEAIMEWYRGTGLRPYLNALPEEKKPEFEQEILERVIESYPVQQNGEIIFRFPRFFFMANKL